MTNNERSLLNTSRFMSFLCVFGRGGCLLNGWRLSNTAEQLSNSNAQTAGDLLQAGERYVRLAAFDIAHVGAAQLAPMGKFFLVPASLQSQAANSLPKLKR